MIGSSSDVEEVAAIPPQVLVSHRMADSTLGIQACSAVINWSVSLWDHLLPEERFAWQSCSFFLLSDMRWHGKGLPMWSRAQERASKPEEAESERTASFSSDHSNADCEADVGDTASQSRLRQHSLKHSLIHSAGVPNPLFSSKQTALGNFRGRDMSQLG